MVHRVHDKKQVIPSKITYARALQLLYMTLRRTQDDLESIYFSYVLKPALQAQQSIVMSCVCMITFMAREMGHKGSPSNLQDIQHQIEASL